MIMIDHQDPWKVGGILWMMKRLYTVMGRYVYYGYIFSDDNTSMRKHLTHPETRPTDKTNIGEY